MKELYIDIPVVSVIGEKMLMKSCHVRECIHVRLNECAVMHIYLRRGGYVFVGVCLFVCLQDYSNTTQLIFTKFGRTVPHGTRRKSEEKTAHG